MTRSADIGYNPPTHQEILEQAIQKAMAGGWNPLHAIFDGSRVQVRQWQDDGMVTVCIWNDLYEYNPLTWVRELEGIIFSHDFARALWGGSLISGKVWYESGVKATSGGTIAWKWHLQQMVIADDPIEYLGEHL
jgi:hypothetical protein